MASNTALAALALGGFNATWSITTTARGRHARQRAIAPDSLRAALDRARRLLNDVVVGGGLSIEDLLSEERKYAERDVLDEAKRQHDRQLRSHLRRVTGSLREVFALAIPGVGPRVYTLGSLADDSPGSYADEDRGRQPKIQRQVDAARPGLEGIEAALDRLAELEKRAV